MQVASATATTQSFVPYLRLRSETILVDQGEGFAEDFQPVQTAVIDLHFDYGGTLVPAGDSQLRSKVTRDPGSEDNVRRILEGFGPVDLTCLDDCAVVPGQSADYAVHLQGDAEALCSFSSHALPRLRAMGWRIDVEDDYPCRVVDDARWYADVVDGGEERDWFELELGVDVDGERVDLVPVLVELIEGRGIDALLASSRRQVPVPIGKGRFLAVSPQRIRAIAQVLAELYAIEGCADGGRLKVPKMISSYFEELEGAFDPGELSWSGERTSERPSLPAGVVPEPVAVPRGLRATLRPYQEEGLAFLQHLRANGVGGILADDMGLGKTLQTIAHIVEEKESGRMSDPVLIVAPTSLVGNWQRELAKFAPSLKVVAHHGPRRQAGAHKIPQADVVITTYGLLARDVAVFEDLAVYLLVLDEAQMIKNARSQAHRTVRGVHAEFRLCLSGTPIENNLEELWALLDFVAPGLLGDLPRFRSAFRIPIERNGNEERMEVLRKRVAPYILRRLKQDVASELPPKTEIVRPLDLRGDQRDLYESIRIAAHATVRKAVKKKGVAASTIDILGALMKLRQVCCDPRLVRVKAAQGVVRSAKFEALFDMLGPMVEQGRRILIFSQFTSMLSLIAEELYERKVSFVSITGSTNNRQEAVDAFQSGQASVFLISLKAGGTGLNLTAADTVIHYDPWWNPAAQAQATDRAYRIGQRNPVFVYNFIVAGSVEERMLNLQRRKHALAEGLLATHDGAALDLSADDVDDLFAPLTLETS